MPDKELEAEVDSAEALDADETTETGEDNETPDKTSKNKSNFKELSKSLKAERAEKAKLAQEKAELEEELNAWRSENPDLVKETLSKKSGSSDKGELALFLINNPDAKNHLDDLNEYLSEMKNPDIEKAWKYVKPTVQQSESKSDFSIKAKPQGGKKLENMTIEEAYAPGALTKEERYKWNELHPDGK